MIIIFKQKTAYEMLISDWSSDVCSSDLWEEAGKGDRFMSITTRIEVKPLSDACGAEIVGADLGTELPKPVVDEIQQAWYDHQAIGRASCRERVCQYVSSSVVDVTIKKT